MRQDLPFIISEHNSGFYYNDQGFENYFEDVKRILKKSSRCFAVSKYYSKYLTKLFQNEVEWGVHHNIVSNQFLNTPLLPNNKQKFTFICISRFSKIKNFPLLINSFKKFNDIVPDSKLKIIGVGSEKKNIEKLVSNYGLDKKVQFLGRKLRNEVIKEVNLSHALVYASSFETFGVIFVEALSLGKPVVTTNCGSAVEILNHKVGIISKENNENSLSKSMLQLYNNYDNYDPKYIRLYCEENFSEKKLSVKIINHYKEVLNS